MAELTMPAPVTLREFDEIFEAVKNWGRWGPDDELGTLNYITPASVAAAAALVYVTIKSFQPFPSFPYNYAPLIDGIWLAIGVVILLTLWLRHKDDWIAKAGAATVDADSFKDLPDS